MTTDASGFPLTGGRVDGAEVDLGSSASRSSNSLLLAFIVLSVFVMMTVGQDDVVEVGSPQWWALILPALLLPLLNLGATVSALFGRAWPMTLLLLAGGIWHLSRGDTTAAQQLLLLVWVTAWLSADAAVLRISDLVKVYWLAIALGAVVRLTTDISQYSLLTGFTTEESNLWRVSFFPNVANSGVMSLGMLVLLSHDRGTLERHRLTAAAALYFTLFSFIRTAYICLPVFAFLFWINRDRDRANPVGLFLWAILAVVAVNLLIAFSPAMVVMVKDLQIVQLFLLKEQQALSEIEIFDQLYRPWLWYQHIRLALSSPWMMGWGAFDFAQMVSDQPAVPIVSAGSESLPTRLMAAYGIPSLLFVLFLLSRLGATCLRRDVWGSAAFVTVGILLMHWGSIFHPTNALFAIFMLIAVHGEAAFEWD